MWWNLVGGLLAFCNSSSAGWVVGEESCSLHLPPVTGGYKKIPIITNNQICLHQRQHIYCLPGLQPFRVPGSTAQSQAGLPKGACATAVPDQKLPTWPQTWPVPITSQLTLDPAKRHAAPTHSTQMPHFILNPWQSLICPCFYNFVISKISYKWNHVL